MAENTKKTTLKKYGKIVPVAVAGFVAVSAGTMDAQAEELDINTTDVTPGEEQQTEAAEISTTIDSATKSEDGLKVNVGVDGDEVTDDGELNWGETSGNPNQSPPVTVENGDGSTTTTTTTTTESDVTIKGTVSDEDKVPVTDGDEVKQDVEDSIIEDALGDLTDLEDEDGNKKYDEVIVDAPECSWSDDGKTVTETYTVTVTESEKENKPLTDTELNVILKAEGLTPVEGKPGTYTDETGATVTVKVTDDKSEETTATKWTITVSKTTTTVSDSEDVASQPVENIKDSEGTALSVEEILAKVENGEIAEKDITRNDNGDITKISDGSKTYTITYKETKVDTTGLTADEILSLLPEGYTKDDDGKIFDAEGHELSISTDNLLKYTVAVSVTLTDTQGKVSDPKQYGDTSKSGAEAAAKADAVQMAIKNALKAQGTEIDGEAKYDDEKSTWTVKGKDGNEYTFTITATIDPETGDVAVEWDKEKIEEVSKDKGENVASGETHTVTGSAVVTGGTVVWTEDVNSTQITLTEGGVVDTTNGLFGEKVVDVDGNKVTTEVTNEDGSVTTKTYTFTYGAVLDEDDKKLIADKAGSDVSVDEINFDGLTKITWTVQETTVTTTENNTQSVITSGVTKNDNGTYTVMDGDKEITLTKGEDGKYTCDDKNGTVYILEEEDVPLADADEDRIKAMIAAQYGVYKSDVTINEGKTAASVPISDNETVTVSFDAFKTLTVKKTVTSALATSGSTGVDEMIAKITETVAGADENGKYYITVGDAEYQLSVQDNKLVCLVDGKVQENTETILTEWLDTRYGVLNGDYLVQYLGSLKKAEQGQNKEIKIGNHIDLVAAGEMDVNGEKKDYVILDDGLQFVWDSSAKQIVKGNGTDIADSLRDEISYDIGKWDVSKDGYWEYAHEAGSQVQNQSNKDGKVGIPQTSAYYKVSGTVAYDHVWSYLNEFYAEQCVSFLKKDGYDNAIWVQVGDHYEVYRHQADLTAYGYMDQDSNVCGLRNDCNPKNNGGYDLKLQNLTLVDGKVTATVGYSADLTKKTEVASGSSLTLTGETTKTTTNQSGENGSDFSGSYKVTEDLGDMNVKGADTANYYTYKTYGITTAEGSAEGTRYGGQLDYTYVEVTEKTVEKDRDVNVTLEKTTEKTEETTTPAGPGTPSGPSTTPDPDPNPNPNPGPGTTPDPEPNPNPNPGPGTTPDPEPTDIADEDVPLTEMPDGEGSLTEIPDDEGSLTEMPDGEIPLSETPEDVEIPDEEVPMAMVPKTGDASLSWFLAAIASALGLAGLTIADRKRKSEDAE